jgi:hypothetical protein
MRQGKKSRSTQKWTHNGTKRRGRIEASATVLPSELFDALQIWFDTAHPGAELLIKIAAGEDERGGRGVLIRAEAEALRQTIFTLLTPERALKLADTLERYLPHVTHDATKLDVYSGLIVALREAAKDHARRRSGLASR